MMLSIRGLYQILAYVYEIINAYSIKSLMVVPFMNLLKSTLSPIPCKCPVSEYCQILHFPLPPDRGLSGVIIGDEKIITIELCPPSPYYRSSRCYR